MNNDDVANIFKLQEAKEKHTFKLIVNAYIIKELQFVLSNASGGGNWRRIINQRIKELDNE